MTDADATSISAVVAAYQAEDFIGDAIDSILNQTRPPDEVIVVDDGSTDGTADELRRFGDRIRVLRQTNRGYQAAMNRAIGEARGDFVALCGADDIWEPQKLEWQDQAIRTHPEVDVLFGHAVTFGRTSDEWLRLDEDGIVDRAVMRDVLFRHNFICTPFVVVRRALFDRLGPFVEDFPGDDYDWWFRCLQAGTSFYYDPRLLGRYRKHANNVTNDRVALHRAMNLVRYKYAGLADDRRLVGEVLAADFFRIGRLLVDDGRHREARDAFRRTLRYAPRARLSDSTKALAWLLVLSLPAGARQRSGRALASLNRTLVARRAADGPASP